MLPKYECDCCKGRKLQTDWSKGRPKYGDAVERHLMEFAGNIAQVTYSKPPGERRVDVYVSGPTRERPYCTLLTAGLSDRPMVVSAKGGADLYWAELSICLPPDWRFTRKAQRKGWWWWPMRELLEWARYPHRSGRLIWYHHTVGRPEPLAPNLPFECMLLHPSLVYPEEFWGIRVSPTKTIHVLSLYPLHGDEYALCVESGAHALIDRLEEGGVTDLFDPDRKSVVGGGGR